MDYGGRESTGGLAIHPTENFPSGPFKLVVQWATVISAVFQLSARPWLPAPPISHIGHRPRGGEKMQCK